MKSMEALLQLMQRLRDPENGCPWDKAQDFASIVPHTIEEAYEVADAIEKQDMQALREELGDLLLQVVFHAQMAQEQGLFGFEGIVEGLYSKLVQRHPHVFGNEKIATAAEQAEAWERIKQDEKRKAGLDKDKKIFSDIPTIFPAMTRALKLQKKAARAGFDWPDVALAFDKLDEEIHELRHIMDKENHNLQKMEEMGDILFCCINIARKLDIDPEMAVRFCNRKFESRITYIQHQLDTQGHSISDASFQQLTDLWDEAKIMEGRE